MADGRIDSTRLREAREYLGFSLDQATGRLGWPHSLLAAIEDGTAEPDAVQAEALCKLYMRPLSWFAGEFRFTPAAFTLCGTEDLTPGDREAVLDFAEFLACKAEMERSTGKDSGDGRG